eukprot:2782740-Pleurochrysis_carterae.AAC.1
MSRSTLFASAHRIAVAPRAASNLSFGATGTPPAPVGADAARAHLDAGQLCTTTPLPALPSTPQPSTLTRRIAAAVPLAMAPPPVTESFVSRHIAVAANSLHRYAPVVLRT